MGLDITFNRRSYDDIGYFRKVNFLVRFFENQGYRVENCVPLEIAREDISELIKSCERVLKDKVLAPSILPTTDGFFFGDVAYNDTYFNDVKEVLEYCKETLLPQFDSLDGNEYITFDVWY